eukprot:CAMPEP_0204903152 /NCGR_PEP_ID=MMETSP1397-20131031/4078_1 /ASSEMBLY_ACC=CAM_ASM_000891 /TAXON_ID=49980 /ORGANISM="Climacostomum Climacostomum virens, Strain Stock W-24" /LENGTH=283 /DNA_ID=CAMNT_0052071739 /DNA_START=623 /DNA_END=1474 /DNA_ORIENTATION=-
MLEEARQLRTKIRELCIYLHTENAGFYPDEDVDSKQITEVLKLSPAGMLTYVRRRAQDIFQQSRSEGPFRQPPQNEVHQLIEELSKRKTREKELEKHIERLQTELDFLKNQLSARSIDHEIKTVSTSQGSINAACAQASTQTQSVSYAQKGTQTKALKVPTLKEKIESSMKPAKAIRTNLKAKPYRFKNVSVSPMRLELDPNRLRKKTNDKASSLDVTQRGQFRDKPSVLGLQTLRKPNEEPYKSLKVLGPNMYGTEQSLVSLISHLQERLLVRSSSAAKLKR